MNATCIVDSCKANVRARNWCGKHYMRWYKYGDPLALKPPMSTEQKFRENTQSVGDCVLWTAGASDNGYGIIHDNGKRKYAHRYAWEQANGPIPDGAHIDHQDHCDKRCVNPAHLRVSTVAENTRNRAGVSKRNKSTGIRNVYPKNGKFQVLIGKDGKQVYCGTYESIAEATQVARQKRIELFGEFAGKG